MSEQHHHHHHHRHHRHYDLFALIAFAAQAVVSLVVLVMVASSGILPAKFLVPIVIVILALAALEAFLVFVKKSRNPARILGLALAVVLAIGGIYFHKTYQTLDNISDAKYKTDTMIVAVKKNDKANTITDAKDYRFGDTTIGNANYNAQMLKQIQTRTGQYINLRDYDSPIAMGQALENGEIQAAMYNEGYTDLINDSISGYKKDIKIIFRFNIKTKLTNSKKSVDEPFNLYISGIDVYGDVSTTSRSDVNIVMTVNPKTRKILLTTTPRDYYVTIPGISGNKRDKLTHAGLYGVDASERTLEKLYNMDISYYVRINFTSLIKIVDELGGIDVNSEVAFTAGGYSFKKGVNHLDGKQALAFSRERHAFDSGDNQRGKDQEAVLTAIINKLTSPAVIPNAMSIMTNIQGAMQTDLTQNDIKKLVNRQLADSSSWKVSSQSVTGRSDNQTTFSGGSQKLYVMWPDDTGVAAAASQIETVLGER